MTNFTFGKKNCQQNLNQNKQTTTTDVDHWWWRQKHEKKIPYGPFISNIT